MLHFVCDATCTVYGLSSDLNLFEHLKNIGSLDLLLARIDKPGAVDHVDSTPLQMHINNFETF